MSRTRFRVNLHNLHNIKRLLARNKRDIWSLSDSNKIQTHKHLVRKQTLNHLPKLAKWWSCVVSTNLYGAFDSFYYNITYAFQSESKLYRCLNVKKLLAQNRRDIWRLSDTNEIGTHNHLVCERTLNHLAKRAKWWSCVVGTYLYNTFDCMLLYLNAYY